MKNTQIDLYPKSIFISKSIITLAGNLDHVAFNKHHGTPKMTNSLNPIDYIKYVQYVPQLHLSGEYDTRVPAFIAKEFVKKSNQPHIKFRSIKNVTHFDGWNKYWNKIINQDWLKNE